ncbi:MAG: hypothetical protein ABL921_19035 [Pirellula sp.]
MLKFIRLIAMLLLLVTFCGLVGWILNNPSLQGTRASLLSTRNLSVLELNGMPSDLMTPIDGSDEIKIGKDRSVRWKLSKRKTQID